MAEEVRYHMLRPAQAVKRRRECPIAWLPIGNLEWHGVHNPLGTDTLQAEAIAVKCAEHGGLAFPPLYYGESRLEALMEANARDRGRIAELMELPSDNFTQALMPFSPAEQALNYHRLLLHVLAELETLGFEVGVLVAGHYPLIDHARAAVLQFNQRDRNRPSGDARLGIRRLSPRCQAFRLRRRPRRRLGNVPHAGHSSGNGGFEPAAA